ncbi:hypothetical protein HYZ97_01035 [Candidatus Pacearchaeota archaeon]|nr:hypothetical protein [Candidatus Pacearchaeota archaeon]
MRNWVVITISIITLLIVSALIFLVQEEPSNPEKDKIILERSYPEIIKGNWEPSTHHMDLILENEIENIKALGVNTISIVPHYDYKDKELVLRDRKQDHIDRILKAKENGFAILLVPDFVGGDNAKSSVPLSQFLEDARNISLEWASIAEEYEIEYFAPQNEFDWFIRHSYFNDSSEHFDEAVKISSKWHQDIIPEIKVRFEGKTMYKFASESNLINTSGYDYAALDFGHYQRSLSDFREGIKRIYNITSYIAHNSNSSWIVGEAWMPYKERRGPIAAGDLYSQDNISINDLQDEYFQVAGEEYLNFQGPVKPSGFIFIAYLMPSMEIKDRPAEKTIRDFFEKMSNSTA